MLITDLPPELLSNIVLGLDEKYQYSFSLANRYLRKISIPFIFSKVKVYEPIYKFNNSKRRNGNFEVLQSIFNKYNRYITTLECYKTEQNFSSGLINLKAFTEAVGLESHYENLSEKEMSTYKNLKSYKVRLGVRIVNFLPVLSIFSRLNELAISGIHSQHFPIKDVQNNTLKKFSYSWGKLLATDIYLIHKNFPNIQYFKLFVGSEIIDNREELAFNHMPVFSNLIALDVEINGPGQDLWYRNYFSNSHCWPTLKFLRLDECYRPNFGPINNYDNLETLHLNSPFLNSSTVPTNFINVTNLKIVSFRDTFFASNLLKYVKQLPKLTSLELEGAFHSTLFNLELTVNLHRFKLVGLQRLCSTFISFLGQLKSCRSIEIVVKVDDENLDYNRFTNIKFPVLMYLNVECPNVRNNNLNNVVKIAVFERFIRERAPLLQ